MKRGLVHAQGHSAGNPGLYDANLLPFLGGFLSNAWCDSPSNVAQVFGANLPNLPSPKG